MSLCELLDDFIEEQHLVAGTAAQALAVALAPTRWSIASCDVAGIDGNLSVATSVQVVENTVTTAIDDLDELADLDF